MPPANQACSGGPGGFPPAQRKGPSLSLPRSPPLVSRSRSLSLSHSLLLLPFPWLLFSRTLLTRQADPPYPAVGPPLPGSRQADTPYLPSGRAADSRCILLSYSDGGYSLRGRRILLATREAGIGACLCLPDLTPGFFSHHRPRPDVQAGPRASSPPANQALRRGSGGFPPGSRRRECLPLSRSLLPSFSLSLSLSHTRADP